MTEGELYHLLLQRVDPARRYIQRRIPRRVRRVLSVDDILQNSWIAAFRTVSTFRDDGSDAFDRWFSTIVRSRLLNAIRYANQAIRSAKRVQDQNEQSGSCPDLIALLADSGRTASSECAGREAVQAIRLAISALPDDYRKAITLHYFDGCSQAEVATAMKRTEAAVNGLLYRGLIKLRERMGKAERFLTGLRK